MSAERFLVLATSVHLGFQAVVTIVVYPALANLPPQDWAAGHAAHSRRMVAVVIPVYAATLIALGWALATLEISAPLVITAGALILVWATTAFAAAPIHHRLSIDGPTPLLLRSLRRADAVRLVGALVACGAALFV